MTDSRHRDGESSTRPGSPLLEYVTIPACADCHDFEQLLQRVVPDFPMVEVREVGAATARGMAISVERGVLRFPVILLDDEIIAIESISELDLRSALSARSNGR